MNFGQHKEKERKKKFKSKKPFSPFLLSNSRPNHIYTQPNMKITPKKDQEQEESKNKRRIIKKKEEEGRREAKQAIQPSTSTPKSSLSRAKIAILR